MVLDDTIYKKVITEEQDENLDFVTFEEWQVLGKCKILPNESASKIKTEDGNEYVYSYVVIMKKPKVALPKEGDYLKIAKKDGSITKELQCKGFVTLKNWLKLWL